MPQRINRYDPTLQDNKAINLAFPKVEAPHTSLAGLQGSLLQAVGKQKEKSTDDVNKISELLRATKLPIDAKSFVMFGEDIGTDALSRFTDYYNKNYGDPLKKQLSLAVAGDPLARAKAEEIHQSSLSDKNLINAASNIKNASDFATKLQSENYTDTEDQRWKAVQAYKAMKGDDLFTSVIPFTSTLKDFDPLKYADDILSGMSESDILAMARSYDPTYDKVDTYQAKGVTGDRVNKLLAATIKSKEGQMYLNNRAEASIITEKNNLMNIIKNSIDKEQVKAAQAQLDDLTARLSNPESDQAEIQERTKNERIGLWEAMTAKYINKKTSISTDNDFLLNRNKAASEAREKLVGASVDNIDWANSYVDVENGEPVWNQAKWNKLDETTRNTTINNYAASNWKQIFNKLHSGWGELIQNSVISSPSVGQANGIMRDINNGTDEQKKKFVQSFMKAVSTGDKGYVQGFINSLSNWGTNIPKELYGYLNRHFGDTIKKDIAKGLTSARTVSVTLDNEVTNNIDFKSQAAATFANMINASNLTPEELDSFRTSQDAWMKEHGDKKLGDMFKTITVGINPLTQNYVITAQYINTKDDNKLTDLTFNIPKNTAKERGITEFLNKAQNSIDPNNSSALDAISDIKANANVPIKNIESAQFLQPGQATRVSFGGPNRDANLYRLWKNEDGSYQVHAIDKKTNQVIKELGTIYSPNQLPRFIASLANAK